MSGLRGRLRQGGTQVAVVVAGLVLGLAGTALYRSQSTDRPSRTPSATKFSFPTPASLPVVSSPADDGRGPDTEPADAVVALTAFLQAQAAGQPEVAWSLLDAAGRQQWPTAAAWSATQGERAPPVTFEVTPPGDGQATGDVDLTVAVDRVPSLDQFRGLVAARSTEVWRVRNEGGRWRVGAKPVESRALLAADTSAPDAVRGWVDALIACDQAGALRFQVDDTLLGPSDVAAAPCQKKGTWAVGSPVSVDRAADVAPLLAAYGQSAATWARLVAVEGAGYKFWAEVAPVGDAWMVVGVAAGG